MRFLTLRCFFVSAGSQPTSGLQPARHRCDPTLLPLLNRTSCVLPTFRTRYQKLMVPPCSVFGLRDAILSGAVYNLSSTAL
ncbi:hypothetical protein B0H11DRAFT_2005768 [Mycena galericulata]|nr:hypothetical protein B0H11DRAFT_2005768 [Mycena galericulata]